MTEQQDIDAQREQLRQHLDALEDRLNPKKVASRTKDQIRERLADDPTPLIAAAAGVVALIGGIVTLVVFGRRH